MNLPAPTDPIKAAESIGSKGAAPKSPVAQSNFEAQMQGAPKQAGKAPVPSPAELAAGPSIRQEPSIASIAAQVSTSQEGFGTIKQQLNTKNLNLKTSQQRLLGNKLSDANEHVQAAGSKLGANPPAPSSRARGGGPVSRFLGLIGDGENQLKAIQEQLASISKSGKQIQASDMLLVQIKMGQAQQEIEYASVLLSKVIDALKTTLNTPL